MNYYYKLIITVFCIITKINTFTICHVVVGCHTHSEISLVQNIHLHNYTLNIKNDVLGYDFFAFSKDRKMQTLSLVMCVCTCNTRLIHW